MKKLIVYGMALVLCLGAGCKKDNNKPARTYLLKQQITDNSANGLPLDTANYAYDDHNRVITITDGSGQDKVTFAVTYDDQGRVNTAKKLNYTGGLIIEYDFFYQGSAAGYYFYGPAHVADTAAFVFNDKHQVTEIDSRHSGRTTFAYDARGNVASTQEYGTDGVNNFSNEDDYVYDTMKNPFSQIPSGNLLLEYIVFIDDPSTLINNVVSKDGEPFTYSYNADGFPVNAVITLYNRSKIKLYFNYIIK